MHWDFFTVMSVLSGIVLMVAALAGPVIGTAGQRLGLFAFGVLSVVYGIWVARQSSGIYFFSVVPAGLAIVILVRGFQHLAKPRSIAAPPIPDANHSSSSTPALRTSPTIVGAKPVPNQPSMLQAAQPPSVREAVGKLSSSFCPQFALLKWKNEIQLYKPRDLNLAWSIANDIPELDPSEHIGASWFGSVRLKVAINKDLQPTTASANVTWVTTFDGPGSIVLTDRRLIGIARAGETMFGAIGQDEGKVVALWSLDLGRCSSVDVDTIGTTSAIVISSDTPAGRLTLTNMRLADDSNGHLTRLSEVAHQIESAQTAFRGQVESGN